MKTIKKVAKKKVKLSKAEGTTCSAKIGEVVSNFDIVEIKNTISKLEIDLGRDDLNLLRDKINEVIEKKCQ